MIIYKTTNTINGKIYVGKDCSNNSKYLGSGSILKSAIKKYGKENFIKEILEECTSPEYLKEREIYWISKLNSRDPLIGYNISPGGDGFMKGVKQSDEHIKKRANSNRGKKRSDETRSKISKANKGQKSWAKGTTKSKETREKMSQSAKGRKLSDETRIKVGESAKGRPAWNKGLKTPEDIKKKLSEAKKGKKLSLEHIEKISASNTGRKNTDEAKNNMREAWKKRKLTSSF